MSGEQFSGVVSPYEVANTVLYVEEEEVGTGLLNISEDNVKWTASSVNREIRLKFPDIAIHAVCRDTTVFPYKPCILLVYYKDDEDDAEEEANINYRLSTQEPQQLDQIYELISDCQQLYPDAELSSDSAEGDADSGEADGEVEGYFTTADGLRHLSLEGEAVLSHLENILVQNRNTLMEDDSIQFEDAEHTD